MLSKTQGNTEMNMPQHPSAYRKRAEECVQLAQSARAPQQRTMLLHIAETWLRLADDAEQSIASQMRPGATGLH